MHIWTPSKLLFTFWTFVQVSFATSMPSSYEDPINYDDFLETTQQTYIPNESINDYDKSNERDISLDSYWNKYQLVLLNTQMNIECPLNLKSTENKILNKFKFGEILFYKSIHDFNIVNYNEQLEKKNVIKYEHNDTLYFKLKSKKVFKVLFNNLIAVKENVRRWQTNKLIINNTRFSDSGRYYCVYSYKGQYLITGNLYVVYEGKKFNFEPILSRLLLLVLSGSLFKLIPFFFQDEILRKSFNEFVRLEPAVDKYLNENRDLDTKNIQWKFNNLSTEYFKLNVGLFPNRTFFCALT